MSAKGCEAAQKQAASVVSAAPRRLALLPVPGSSRTSPLPQKNDRGPAKCRPVRTHNALLPGGRADLSAKGCEAALKQAASVVSGASRWLVLLPVPGSSRTSPTKKREIANQRSVARSAHITRFCPEGVGVDLSTKGCEAAPKQAASVVSAASRWLALLPVPGSSRTSPTKKREIANQRSLARSAHITRFCPEGVGVDLSAKGCEAALKQAASVVSAAPRRLALLPVPGSSRTSPLPHKRSVARCAPRSR